MGVEPYSAEGLRELLRAAKVTQQSIQGAAHWMLERRTEMDAMAREWLALLQEEPDASQQVVYLYVANEALQVGARKFGRSVTAAFIPQLLAAAEFVMRAGHEKVKRCLMKVVGIWAERRVVPPADLEMLQRVCAGKPAVEPEPEVMMVDADGNETGPSSNEALMKEMVTDAAIERVLDGMPEAPESAATAGMAQRLQDLVSATISADLLSDRMFQLESSLEAFHQACEAYAAYADDNDQSSAAEDLEDENELSLPRTGAIDWSMVDQQVYDLDVDRSRDHVQQYRANLEDQSAKREALLSHARAVESMDLFGKVTAVSEETMDAQCRALERLFKICFEAEALQKRRLEEQRAAYVASGHHSNSVLSNTYAGVEHRGGEYSPSTAKSDYRKAYGRDPAMVPPAPLMRRHSSSGSFHERDNNRYYRDEGQSPKRAKLVHSHSLEPQNPKWSRDAPSPRFGEDRYDRFEQRGPPNSYTAVEEEGRGGYRSREPPSRFDRYHQEPSPRFHQNYDNAPPRHNGPDRGGRRSRWDSMPDDFERRSRW